MRKTLTLVIVFLLILPTLPVFLQKVQAEEYTFGKTDIGANTTGWGAKRQYGCNFTLSEDGDVTKISWYGKEADGVTKDIKAARACTCRAAPSSRLFLREVAELNDFFSFLRVQCMG